MIAGFVMVPGAPLLLPEYTGRVDVAASLREAALSTLGRNLVGRREVVIVCGTHRHPTTSRPALGLRVAEVLLASAGWGGPVRPLTVPFDASPDEIADSASQLHELDGQVLVVVVADGGARRGEKAPGHLDERTFAVDDAIVDALRNGDSRSLLEVDAGLCEDLMITGRAAWQVMATAAAAGGGWRGRVDLADDPFGVLYIVGQWRPDD